MTPNAIKIQTVYRILDYTWFKENSHKNHDYNSYQFSTMIIGWLLVKWFYDDLHNKWI